MDESGKALSVSVGALSCTVTGYDDPFDALDKVIARALDVARSNPELLAAPIVGHASSVSPAPAFPAAALASDDVLDETPAPVVAPEIQPEPLIEDGARVTATQEPEVVEAPTAEAPVDATEAPAAEAVPAAEAAAADEPVAADEPADSVEPEPAIAADADEAAVMADADEAAVATDAHAHDVPAPEETPAAADEEPATEETDGTIPQWAREMIRNTADDDAAGRVSEALQALQTDGADAEATAAQGEEPPKRDGITKRLARVIRSLDPSRVDESSAPALARDVEPEIGPAKPAPSVDDVPATGARAGITLPLSQRGRDDAIEVPFGKREGSDSAFGATPPAMPDEPEASEPETAATGANEDADAKDQFEFNAPPAPASPDLALRNLLRPGDAKPQEDAPQVEEAPEPAARPAPARAGLRVVHSDAEDDEPETPARAFARQHGAEELIDLVVAAAAYVTQVEGKPRFARSDLNRPLAEMAVGQKVSEEAKVKTFGKLLRQGAIQRDENLFILAPEKLEAFSSTKAS